QAVVVDSKLGFDPWALLPFGPELDALTVVRPPHEDAAGEAATALARAGAGFLLAPPLPETWLNTLEGAAARSGTVVVVVAEAVPPALAHASSLSFDLERSRWVWDRGPLVVAAWDGPVVAASEAAAAYGVRPGIPLRQAQQRCPQAEVFPPDPEQSQRLRQLIASALYDLAPVVEARLDGVALIDLAGV